MKSITRQSWLKGVLYFFFLLLTASASSQSYFSIHPEGYLHGRGISVLTYHNDYYVGKQGGIEIIQNDRRIMTNGMVSIRHMGEKPKTYEPEFFAEPIPETTPVYPKPDPENTRINIPFQDIQTGLKYEIHVQGHDSVFTIQVDFNDTPLKENIQEISFEIELFPGFYRGKSFLFDTKPGTFPLNFHHAVEQTEDDFLLDAMGRGRRLIIAPETPEICMEITAQNGVMELIDTRSATNHNWYTLKAVLDIDKLAEEKFSLTFRPNVEKDYVKDPVIGYSQIGYHPDQQKKIIIEADPNYVNEKEVLLYTFNDDEGKFRLLRAEKPEFWGQYNRYHIYTFDFSDVREEGLYYFQIGEGEKTNPFRISKEVFSDGVWQPTLETFLPVQMCHMRIRDRNRIWHGVCHLDDAMQAPPNLPFYDGFSQGEFTETGYEGFETIPGINKGGWHDAGDDDVNSNSTGRTVYHLALIKEEFGIETDQTTIDFENREVFLHRPDGESDLIQNMKHGLDFLLGSYDAVGHGIVGMISSDFNTYIIPGTWENMTDQLFYSPELKPGHSTKTHSARRDDRFAFTNKDSRAEFRNSYVFATASRVLKESDDSLAAVCLEWAEKIWNTEMNSEPVFYHSVGVPGNLENEKINAAVELYLTTGKKSYLNFLETNMNSVYKDMEANAWALSRVMNDFTDQKERKKFGEKLVSFRDSLLASFDKNPYGTYLDAELWGYGWDILWRAYKYYYLTENYPELFPIQPILNCNEFMLGRHPYSNASYVSGVGTEVPLPAFGMNRSDYSYIPGGVFSGVNMIEPDFPELLEDHPYIWQQSEYIIHGATPFVFTILAADKYYNKEKYDK